jgi:type II secretory pathway predicted ATPase ExeA
MEVAEGKLITFIFFGMSEMEDVLALDEPLKQRISLKCRLAPLEGNNTREYINHRIRVAGAEKGIFTADAINRIHAYAKGVPRVINTICDNALLEGFLLKKENVDEEIIDSVAITLGLANEVKVN